MQFNKVTDQIVEELKAIVGQANVLYDEEKMEMYSRDEVSDKLWEKMPEVVVKPETAEQVSQIVKLANRELIPIVPRGAGTGLAAGAVPLNGGIVVSMEKMNKILELDTENLFMVVQPGVTTGEVQKTAKANGLLYAGDPCSADSSFIGGNVATNAGGNKAVKYGVTSRHIYGLEIVMPNGDIVTFGGKNVKDVTGYDIIHLMVGSEGTLGIVTKIWLKLMPLPKYVADLLIPFADMQTAIKVVPKIMTAGIIPTCLEFMDSLSIKSAEMYLNKKLPYSDAGAYIICEIDGTSETQVQDDYETIGKLCLENGALEVFVADNMSTQERIWKARKCYAEAIRMISPVYCMEDIVVPVSNIPKCLEAIERIAKKYNCKIPSCGHAGDGNIHATVMREGRSEEEWHELKDNVLGELYEEVYALGGNLSGEHGIGAKRAEAMNKHMTDAQLSVLRAIKKALDPNGIMNPGKVLVLE
ncbi:D-lactate dehydrogenase (cytochrome) [Desulfotomaculum nigrificans CO-1-SRB]|uniref:D-lactate dehydrogenase (Cytochrome) n=1 Tax=Desulfotomaculum nigrificans (strain DSM 14880 / VKM B-2319 / CO-1-SRB) TaxID=868595 RepID=F6B2V2_DESCC|nr:FAD-linked oxidase C-terminal domain-containing protein [Desulfotomaculum nigrificans]AEF95060.1 D-lactate dehydrogenase (cytochrome) [Desulfotomaculum nigrificans CO-1-SRB]